MRNQSTFGPVGADTHHEPDLLLQSIPKATRFRKKLVYALLGTSIAAVSVIFTYGLMKSNHHDIVGAGKAHESTAATVPDISEKLPKNYADVRDLAAKQRKAGASNAGTADRPVNNNLVSTIPHPPRAMLPHSQTSNSLRDPRASFSTRSRVLGGHPPGPNARHGRPDKRV